jgi:hypothetical protein
MSSKFSGKSLLPASKPAASHVAQPRFRIGQRVRCLVRGEVIITGMTDAPIPWPIAKGGRGRHSLASDRS